jgi:hypothetical protein
MASSPFIYYHLPCDWLVSVARPKPADFGGLFNPNSAAGFGRATETSCRVWVERPKLRCRVSVERPKPSPKFGTLDPNHPQGLGRSTQTNPKVSVARPKPCSRVRSSEPNFGVGFGRSTETLQLVSVERPKQLTLFIMQHILYLEWV